MRAAAAAVLAVGIAFHGLASAETVKLENGDKLEGVTVVEKTDEKWVLEHPVLGRIEVPASQIKPPKPPKPPKPGLFGTSFLAGWTRSASLGFSGSSGVTQENNVNASLELKNKTEHHRDEFVARYFFADANKENTNNEFEARHTHDFLFPGSKWFAFLSGNYKYDEFQAWDHRVIGAGGVGYDFLRDDTYTLSGRLGPGFTVTRGGGDDREDFNGVAALQGTWALYEGVDWSAEAGYFPVLNDMPDFRALGRTELKLAVGVIEGLSVKAGYSYEYDSQNEESNDRKYYGALVYDF